MELIYIIYFWYEALKRMHHHFCGIPDNTTKQPESKQEKTSDKLKLRDILWNNWPVIFQNVNVMQHKGWGTIPDSGRLKRRDKGMQHMIQDFPVQ